jgi:acetyl/propionyl-CoA carboxylase alpha subunit
VRVDHALETGGTIPTHYDSMIAKLVAHGRTREEARQKLLRAVQDCVLLGVPSNQPFLASCLASAAFTGNDVHTGFVDAHMQASLQPAEPSRHVIAIAALAASGQLSRSEPAALSRMTTSVRLHAEGDRGNRQWRRQKKAGALPSARVERRARSQSTCGCSATMPPTGPHGSSATVWLGLFSMLTTIWQYICLPTAGPGASPDTTRVVEIRGSHRALHRAADRPDRGRQRG